MPILATLEEKDFIIDQWLKQQVSYSQFSSCTFGLSCSKFFIHAGLTIIMTNSPNYLLRPDLCTSHFVSGEGGIRTLGGPKPTTVFETVPFNHSGTFPNCPASVRDYNLNFLTTTIM